MVFHGKYAVEQPFFQRQIVRYAAKQTHCRVRMRVAKTAHQKISVTVYFAIGNKTFVFLFTDIDDIGPVRT